MAGGLALLRMEEWLAMPWQTPFFGLFLEVADHNISVNISEVAQLMELIYIKGYDIFRRIKRKVENDTNI